MNLKCFKDVDVLRYYIFGTGVAYILNPKYKMLSILFYSSIV